LQHGAGREGLQLGRVAEPQRRAARVRGQRTKRPGASVGARAISRKISAKARVIEARGTLAARRGSGGEDAVEA